MRKLKQAGIVAAVASNSARLDQLAVRGAVLCCKALTEEVVGHRLKGA